MQKENIIGAIECILFVSGDPVSILELQRTLDMTDIELRPLLYEMQKQYKDRNSGILLMLTEETAQFRSNKEYAGYVEELLQPAQQKTFSQTLLETLAIIAYRQPVTRADVETIRGVRCEYAISQLQKINMIQTVGRKDTVGKPALYGTTDAFLRHFNLQMVNELPNYEAYSSGDGPIEGILTV